MNLFQALNGLVAISIAFNNILDRGLVADIISITCLKTAV